MSRPMAILALICLPMIHACSSTDNPTEIYNPVLSVPEQYSTIQAAADDAQDGDRIVVAYRTAPYAGDITLPANVTLMGHVGNTMIPIIEGQVTVVGGDADTRVEDLKIINESGPGLVILDSAVEILDLWILDCGGAGIELRGNSHSYIQSCELEGCELGILITGVTETGHWDDDDHPAARIFNCNFLGNGDPGDLHNITFSDIDADYTVKVNRNYWGDGILDPDVTIWDKKDDPGLKGEADTTYESFQRATDLIPHWWHD